MRSLAINAPIAAADLLSRTNELLQRVGINALPIPSLEELQQSASSMFVAVFEAIFQVRLTAPRPEAWRGSTSPLTHLLFDWACRTG